MEAKIKKCSSKSHKENDAVMFCQDCKIYMCNKCEKFHSEVFENHHVCKPDKENISEIFTGKCMEKNHTELKYFCKTHNMLCCANCITIIKDDENGQHSNCKICPIKDIENEKKNKLEENIKSLEDLSITLEESINQLKIIFEKIDKNKEELKINIQKIFTKLRNTINDREDELLLEVDKFYNLLVNENLIKESELLPNKIKISLEKGKLITNNWKNNKLNSLINDCLNIENNIRDINKINDAVKNNNSLQFEVVFCPDSDGVDQLVQTIKKFGNIKEKSLNNFDSKITFDQSLIKEWLNNRDFKAELLFRKTRDGSEVDDFHKKCDNKGITIIFIETTKGYKFGGYTELQWERKGGSKKDKSTFIFSLNNKQKYTAKNDNGTIYCDNSYCPWFGSSSYPEIYLINSLEKGQSWENSFYNTFFLGRKLTNGEEYWDVKELEAYKIVYI